MTGASVNFKAVKSASHAVSHASREVAPTYLLPPDKTFGTIVLRDDSGAVAATLAAKSAMASRQALRSKDYSPVWEGILNLRRPEHGEDTKEYKQECSDIVQSWCERYEKMTGHKVLRADIHLDEGHMVDGEALLNAHAHVIADRTNDQGRVIKLSPKQLRELQTVTAEVTKLARGQNSMESGRSHISHQAYKYLAERGRLESQKQITELKEAHTVELHGVSKKLVEVTEELRVTKEAHAREVGDLKSTIEKLKADYAKERQALKESGEAKQADYQRLKREHEAALVELKAEKKENVEAVQVVTALLKQRSAAQATQKPVEPPKPAQAGVTTTMSEKEYREALDKHKARLEAAESKIQEIRQAYLDELIEEARKKGMESFAKAKAHEAVLSAHEAAKPLFAGRAAWAERLEELKKQDAANRATHEANRVQHDKLRAGKLPEGFEQIARERVEASHTGIYAAIAATRRTVDEMEDRLQFVQETKRDSGGARRGLDSGMER